MANLDVVLEIGKKRVFASAIDWPGWCRIGRSEQEAIEALLAYAPRYQRDAGRQLGFEAPSVKDNIAVTERLTGNATTDFGAPDFAAAAEARPVDADDLDRLVAVLGACWDALIRAYRAAQGKELQKGPRGGGRSAAQIVEHVLAAHQHSLARISWREKAPGTLDLAASLEYVRRADAKALAFAASVAMPEKGPRGGAIWAPRYFVRRAAWHILDHAWEIEDKTIA